jgi:hypothetical protein
LLLSKIRKNVIAKSEMLSAGTHNPWMPEYFTPLATQ